MAIKLFDSELKVMGVLWREGDCTAKHISDVLAQETGWKMNTTYTLIKRCIGKGAIERTEPNSMCRALIPKEQVQQDETRELIDKIYDGSADQLFAALLGSQKLSREQSSAAEGTGGELRSKIANTVSLPFQKEAGVQRAAPAGRTPQRAKLFAVQAPFEGKIFKTILS